MRFDTQATRQFREAYLVSNTPLYLYKRLRGLPAVQHLAETKSADDLASEFLRRAGAENRVPDDVAIAYACLVALTRKDAREVTEALWSLDVSGLQWASLIRDLARKKNPAAQSFSITVEKPAVPRVDFAADASANFATRPQPKPTVDRKAGI